MDTNRTAISSVISQTPSDSSYSITSEASTIEVIGSKGLNPTTADSQINEIPQSNPQSELSVSVNPSTIPLPPRGIVSSDTQKVLSLLDETFDTSVTGNVSQSSTQTTANEQQPAAGQRSPSTKPESVRSTSALSDGIIATDMKTVVATEQDLATTKYPKLKKISESVWQVGDLETTCDKFDKHGMTPMQSAKSPLTKTNGSVNKSDADAASFIVIDKAIDDDLSMGKLKPIKLAPSSPNTATNRNECTDCYHCNREIHAVGCSDKSCHFCTKHSHKTTSRMPPGDKTKLDSQRYLETRSKSDHSHTQTKSKDSDTISLKCRKINKKVSRYIPVAAEADTTNGNNLTSSHKQCTDQLSSENVTAKKKSDDKKIENEKIEREIKNGNSTLPKLPASSSDWSTSTNSCDTNSSPNESPVFASPRRRSSKNSMPRLPTAERWQQNVSNNNQSNSKQHERKHSRYQEFYDTKVSNDKNSKLTEDESIVAAYDNVGQTKSSGKIS